MERVLLFDSHCSVCKKLAQEIQSEADGYLVARSLHDPEMQALLNQANPNSNWEPTLLEIDDGHVRAFTGWGMRVKLVIELGPRRAWRVARLVQRAGIPLSRTHLERRGFLQRSGMLIAGLAMLGVGASLSETKAQSKQQKVSGQHPLRNVESEESVRLSDEEAEAYRKKALESGDIKHITANHDFNTTEAVVYRHELAGGNRAWIVAFAAPDNGFVAYYTFEQPIEWLQSQAVYYRIEGNVEEGEGTAYLIAMSVNGEGIDISSQYRQGSCDGCQGSQFDFDCEGCAEVNWGCVASFCGSCWAYCVITAGPLALPCTVACCGASLFAACCTRWGGACCSCFGA